MLIIYHQLNSIFRISSFAQLKSFEEKMHFKELWNQSWLCLCNNITNLDAANLKINDFIYSALEAKPFNVHVQLLINCSGFCPNNGVGVWLQDFVPIIGGGLTVSQVFIQVSSWLWSSGTLFVRYVVYYADPRALQCFAWMGPSYNVFPQEDALI